MPHAPCMVQKIISELTKICPPSNLLLYPRSILTAHENMSVLASQMEKKSSSIDILVVFIHVQVILTNLGEMRVSSGYNYKYFVVIGRIFKVSNTMLY